MPKRNTLRFSVLQYSSRVFYSFLGIDHLVAYLRLAVYLQVQEELCVHEGLDLDRAFSRIVQHMSETTHQCKNFYKSSSAAKVSEQEKNHVCRFHSQQSPSGQHRPTNSTFRKAQYTGLSEPEDFLIEVSPGTYSVTAAMQDASPQTRVVHISAGESKSLTFDL
uniref:A-kinase interacting protein 1 n=1 Tax=Astyanax mexicanus TaxID=7994 RepID=A0A8B9LC22_ASTMX